MFFFKTPYVVFVIWPIFSIKLMRRDFLLPYNRFKNVRDKSEVVDPLGDW